MNKYSFKSKEQIIMYNIMIVNFNFTILFCMKNFENSRFLYKNIEIKDGLEYAYPRGRGFLKVHPLPVSAAS